jgi:hypothetical protein
MDFENSLYSNNINRDFYFLYKNFYQIINNILYELNIITNNDKIIEYINDSIKENKIININYLLSLIDNLEMIEKRDINKLLKYDPNIY